MKRHQTSGGLTFLQKSRKERAINYEQLLFGQISNSINDLIQDNLDLVKKLPGNCMEEFNIVEVEDLIQQGMEGLVHATQKYSPKEGVNFSQYAQLRIKGYN